MSELIAPCGVYCGVCPYLIAYKNNDEELKKKLADNVGIKPEKVACEGCKSNYPFFFCRACKIKTCVFDRKIESCAVCDEFPCKRIEEYPYKPFIENVRNDIALRRKLGKQKWIDLTIEKNTCPSCQTLNHWRAKHCILCKKDLPER